MPDPAAVPDLFVPASVGFTYVAGMLTALSPCVLPLLPIVVGGAMQQHRSAPLMMGLGMTVAFASGGLLGLAWSPCAGPMLISSAALVASGRDALLGAFLMGLFGLGAATPMVMAAYASRAGFRRLRIWALGHTAGLRHGFGILAMVSGLFIATGIDKWIATQAIAVLPDSWLQPITSY